MTFIQELEKESNKTAFTDNGAVSYSKTGSLVLDFFSKSGALRGKNSELLKLFAKSMYEDVHLSMKALFYMRDVRGGQGERDSFRFLLKHLANHSPEVISPNIKHIVEYGRWDDLYAFVGTPLQDVALGLMKEQFIKDIKNISENKPISLLGKWLKSENTSSKESVSLAVITRTYFGLSSKKYRKALSRLRKEIDIVERLISKNEWSKVEFKKVPSQAARIYSSAFKKHDNFRYSEYLEKVMKGEEKINSSTLYPYDIVKKVRSNEENLAMEVLWKNLPNYSTENENSIAVVDTSGSMEMGMSGGVAPIDVALSLGIYFAERNTGIFKDKFITFSQTPKLQTLKGTSLAQKVKNLSNANWMMNTDLNAVFNLILSAAKKSNAKQEELPSKIYIISDMQFDDCCNKDTNFEVIDNNFKNAGYKRPQLVFWNVNAKSDTPVTKDEAGTFLVSGCSPSILKYAVNCEANTPYQFMLDVLNSERYSVIE